MAILGAIIGLVVILLLRWLFPSKSTKDTADDLQPRDRKGRFTFKDDP